MFILKNGSLRAEFDEGGRLLSLAGPSGNVIDSPCRDFFFANLACEGCLENHVWASRQTVEAREEGCALYFRIRELVADNGRSDDNRVPISIEFRAALEEDGLVFDARIDNRSAYTVLDFEYPRIGRVRDLGAGTPSLFWPQPFGMMFTNIGKRLASVTHRENGSNCLKITYPGYGIMGWCALMDRDNVLSLSLMDRRFYSCALRAKGYPDDQGAVTLSCDKFLCAGEGELQVPPVKIGLYKGTWHASVRAYARMMKESRPSHPVPRWARDMLGFFLVINKQQSGYEMWDYSTIPQLWELAKAHGCDVLALFGWYGTGHDNNYPDLGPGESLGGEAALREAIKQVQKDGGRVILYHQGHLIDRGSPFYRNGEGKRVACKTIWNDEYGEYYSKSHKSDALMMFSNKQFSVACPSAPEWQELMLAKVRELFDLGADGCLFDQVGGMPPYLCFDKTHSHPDGNPALALSGGQRRMLERMQQLSKELDPEFAFMSENITDLYSPYLDAVHGIYYAPWPEGAEKPEPGSEETAVYLYPEVFRYAFPDTRITVRNNEPRVTRRLADFAFLYDAPLELEIRYAADKKDVLADAFPEDRKYAALVTGFRSKYRDMLSGAFADTEGIVCDSPGIYAKAYICGSRVAVRLWNDSQEAVTPRISVPGKRLVMFASPKGEYSGPAEMGPQDIAFAVFE